MLCIFILQLNPADRNCRVEGAYIVHFGKWPLTASEDIRIDCFSATFTVLAFYEWRLQNVSIQIEVNCTCVGGDWKCSVFHTLQIVISLYRRYRVPATCIILFNQKHGNAPHIPSKKRDEHNRQHVGQSLQLNGPSNVLESIVHQRMYVLLLRIG